MSTTRLILLRIVLVVSGLIFLIGLYPLMLYFPDNWTWLPRQAEYEQMILGVYATLGIFLLIASKNPLEHRSLIWFTAWSSLVHATIMLIQAFNDPLEVHNLYGDIPGLYIIGIALALLMPRK